MALWSSKQPEVTNLSLNPSGTVVLNINADNIIINIPDRANGNVHIVLGSSNATLA